MTLLYSLLKAFAMGVFVVALVLVFIGVLTRAIIFTMEDRRDET